MVAMAPTANTIVRLSLLLLATAKCVFCASTSTTSNIAYWSNPRGAVIQQTLVIEGGLLARANYSITSNSFSTTSVTIQPGAYGLLYYLSLCSSFNTSTDDIDALLLPQNETGNPLQNSWIGGALFANDYEWYTYG